MEIFDNIALGLSIALSWHNLLYCFLGVFLGMLVGVLPGIGPLATISMLFPITFHLDPTTALVMLAGIYYGSAYGGSTAAILLNLPGQPSSAVVCLDGYPMAQQGRAGVALLLTTVASFIGGGVGIILMMLFSPFIVDAALEFQAPEYFSLMVLGLIAASTLAVGSAVKSIAMVVLGVILGTVGLDMYTATPRFDFGVIELYEGLDLAVIAMGLFGLTEIVTSVRSVDQAAISGRPVSFRSMIPTRDDVRRSKGATLRGTAVGSLFGILPGAGATISSFMAYAVERKFARNPSRFGKGAVEGVIAPEAANNAADQTAFIPTMTLGIPGSATMALIIGVMIIHGITPGPRLMIDKPDMFWGLVMSFWIGNVMLVLLNLPLIGIWIRVLRIPYDILYPAIMMFICVGAYSLNFSAFDVWMIVVFGGIGYFMRWLAFPAAPLILGFVLGPMMEENFRRAMQLSRGNFMTFFERPISATILVAAIAILVWTIWSAVSGRSRLSPALAED